jgi:hypothetical protein
MIPTLAVEVVEIEVEAEYRGSIYERTVRVRTDSSTLDLFEGKSHVTEDDVGTRAELVVLGRPAGDVTLAETAKRGIEQVQDREDRSSKWEATVVGEVVSLDVSDDWLQGQYSRVLLLDVGLGTVLLSPTDQITQMIENGSIRENSVIRVECSRVDIVGRHSTG